MISAEPFGYTSWDQVTGYFDGDGSVGVEIVKFVLRLRIRYVDTWKQQAESIHSFLIRNGVKAASLTRDHKRSGATAYRVEVRVADEILKVAKEMLPRCVKKAEDLQITIDYLENRITGDEAVARFNAEILIGRRKGHVRKSAIPHTRSRGLRLWKLTNARKARSAYAVDVPDDITSMIKEDRASGLGHYSLARKYSLSESVIRRILGDP